MSSSSSRRVEIFIDSGAYSAKSQGVDINVQDYIQFIQRNREYIALYANLDVIGDAEATWCNQMIMEQAGLRPLPVFHFREDFSWLERYVASYDYIALGGLVGAPEVQVVPFLDTCFARYICDPASRLPKCKVHGFGVTSHKLLVRYPWFSVDSSSWVMASRTGSILVPVYRNGRFDYFAPPLAVSVSNRSTAASMFGSHFSSLPPMEQEIISSYVKSCGVEMGVSEFRREPVSYQLQPNERWFGGPVDGMRKVEVILVPGVVNQYMARDRVCIRYYAGLEQAINDRMPWPWPFRPVYASGGFGL